MKLELIKTSYLVIAGISLTHCSSSNNSVNNFAFAMTQGSPIEYAGEPFLIDPEFTVFEIKIPPGPYTGFSDTTSLKAFSDKGCSQASPGVLTLDTDPVPIASAIAHFSKPVFTWSAASWAEGIIYLKASLTTSGLSYCSIPVSVIQHFKLGSGFVTSGTTSAAGAVGNAVVDQGRAHRLDSEGKWVIAGMSKDNLGGTQATLWRYLPNGTPDPDFGTQGALSLGSTGAAGATGANLKESVTALAIDSTGNYLFAGSSRNSNLGTEFAIWRYRTSGLKDGNFGGGPGSIHSTVSGVTGSATVFDQIRALAIDSQLGKTIVVAGSSLNAQSGTELFLARYLPNGQIDTSFNTTGILSTGSTGAAGGTTNQTSDIATGLQIDSSGRYLVAGSSQDNAGKKHMALWRFLNTGTLDSNWGTQGVKVTGSTGAAGGTGAQLSDEGRGLLIDSKNRIVVVGSSMNSGGTRELALWRYSQDGTVDSSWNGTGSIHIENPSSSQGFTISEDSNQNYVISGISTNATGGNQLTLWLLNENGALNTFLNSQGFVTFQQGTGAGMKGAAGGTGVNFQDIPYSLVIDPYGTYTILGESRATDHTELSLWRYLANGILNL